MLTCLVFFNGLFFLPFPGVWKCNGWFSRWSVSTWRRRQRPILCVQFTKRWQRFVQNNIVRTGENRKESRFWVAKGTQNHSLCQERQSECEWRVSSKFLVRIFICCLLVFVLVFHDFLEFETKVVKSWVVGKSSRILNTADTNIWLQIFV